MHRTLTILLWWLCIPLSTGTALALLLFPSTLSEEIHTFQEGVVMAAREILPGEESTSVLFVGDMMFDRGVARRASEYSYEWLLTDVADLFTESDVVVGNLEGTITNESSIAQKDNSVLRFTFDPAVVTLLQQYNFSAVSLANNHSLDFKESGYTATKNYLSEAGIAYFGSAVNSGGLSTVIEEGDDTICLVGYHDNFTFNATPVLEEIERIKNGCTFVVLFAHWGEEYRTSETERQQSLAHAFVDAGVDLVIGAHPHVIEPIEIYKGKAIFYSLGNFIFDQYFSFNTTHGVAVRVLLSEDEVAFEFFPVAIDYGKVTYAGSDASQKVMSLLIGDGISYLHAQSIQEERVFAIPR